ncbi:RNA polymerase sigma factor [Streptomyces sp. NPDC003642]
MAVDVIEPPRPKVLCLADIQRSTMDEDIRERVRNALAEVFGMHDARVVVEDSASEPRSEYGDVDGVPFEWVEDLVPQDLATFFAEHRPRLKALVRKVFNDCWYQVHLDPEDIVQDTMETAVKNWPRIGRMTHPDRYLRKVAAKKALRAAEKAHREVSVSAEGFLSLFDEVLIGHTSRTPEGMAAAARIRDVLALLPTRQAQVLLLSADGWTSLQIARALHVQEATVRSNRRHAKKFILERLPRDHQVWTDILSS